MHNSIEDFHISTDSQSKLPPNGVPIVAVRPLLSEHHAKHLPPKYITLHWNIGKRCNYDCSYCSPHIHDAVSPHLKFEQAKIFLDRLDNFALERDRILDFFITGGEPFVNPDIIEFFKAINNLKTTSHRLCVTTNGSLPLKMYLQAMDYLTNLTFSVHLERSDKEINSVIKSIVTLGKRFRHEKMISVNLMCLPGRFDKIKQIIDILSREKIYYVLRRIRPSFDEDTRRIYQPHEKKRIKKWGIVPVDEQKKAKEVYKSLHNEHVPDFYEHYYSQEEIAWLQNNYPKVWWQNIGIWYADGRYQESNSDDLVTRNLTGFKNWQCWAGVDHLMVDFDGSIYRGNCKNGGQIGHIMETLDLPTSHTVCKQRVCLSAGDIAQRKCVSQQSANLIN